MIGFALEELYWQHVEYFPCHESAGFNPSLHELIDVYSQGQAGNVVSPWSLHLRPNFT